MKREWHSYNSHKKLSIRRINYYQVFLDFTNEPHDFVYAFITNDLEDLHSHNAINHLAVHFLNSCFI